MIRFLADENFNNHIIRGLRLKQPDIDIIKIQDVGLSGVDDADLITNVKTLFNNDHNNSAGFGVGKDLHYLKSHEGKLVDAKGVQSRYVRCYSNGNTGNQLNHWIEVDVYGLPVK